MQAFLQKIKEYGAIILSVLGAVLFGWIWLLTKKNKTDEAIVQNEKVQEKVNELDKDVAKNDGLLDAEQVKRTDIENKMNEEKKQDASKEDLSKFFNDPNNHV